MPTPKGGLADARAASTDDDPVLSALLADLDEATERATAACAAFGEVCRTRRTALRELETAATRTYLSAGRVMALAARIRTR